MRIVELLNDPLADPLTSHSDDDGGDAARQRAFGDLLVSGASDRFFQLTKPTSGALKSLELPPLAKTKQNKSKTGEGDNPLYLLLRATQEAVDKEKVVAKKVAAPIKQVKEEVKDDKESRGLRQRRAKQRVVFRRCYYKKLNTLTELRETHEALQTEFRRLLAPDNRSTQTGEEGSPWRGRYLALLSEKEDLRAENERLVEAGRQQDKTRDTLRWLVDAELAAVAIVKRMPLPAECASLPPISKAEAERMAVAVNDVVIALRQSTSQRSTNDEVCGWTLGWADESAMVSTKRVSSTMDAKALGRQSMELVSAGAAWLWPGATSSVVQTIDDDHVVVHVWDEATSSSTMSLCCLKPLGDSDDGCALLVQPLDPATGAESTGSTPRCWLMIEGSGADGAFDVEIGWTAIPRGEDLDRRRLVDLAAVCCRWESDAFGPSFTFTR